MLSAAGCSGGLGRSTCRRSSVREPTRRLPERTNLIQLASIEALIPRQFHGLQPEFARHALSTSVNILWFVAIEAIEVEPVWSGNILDRRSKQLKLRQPGKGRVESRSGFTSKASVNLADQAVRKIRLCSAVLAECSP